MVKIIADSCSDLSPELIEKYEIDIVPLDVLIGDTNYKDGITLSTNKLFDLVKTTGSLPKTSAPSITAFQEHFSQPAEIICLSISSKLSATYQTALLAKDGLNREDIFILDSSNLSTGIGLLVLAAAEMSAQGVDAKIIIDRINLQIPKVRTSFVINTLDYIY